MWFIYLLQSNSSSFNGQSKFSLHFKCFGIHFLLRRQANSFELQFTEIRLGSLLLDESSAAFTEQSVNSLTPFACPPPFSLHAYCICLLFTAYILLIFYTNELLLAYILFSILLTYCLHAYTYCLRTAYMPITQCLRIAYIIITCVLHLLTYC